MLDRLRFSKTTNYYSMILIPTILLVLALRTYAQDSVEEPQETENAFTGSIATVAGGTLEPFDFSDYDCENFHSAKFLRIKRHVGLGIQHEYIALILRSKDSENPQNTINQFFVTGLNNESDAQHFETTLDETKWNSKNSVRVYEVKECKKTLDIITGINEITKNTPYRNTGVYAGSILTRPLFGQPCSNIASQIEKDIKIKLGLANKKEILNKDTIDSK